MKQDYVITFKYGDEINNVRVNAMPSERLAVIAAKAKAKQMNYPIDENNISISRAAYQKKTTISKNEAEKIEAEYEKKIEAFLKLENEDLKEKLQSANKRIEIMQMTIDALTEIITKTDEKKREKVL